MSKLDPELKAASVIVEALNGLSEDAKTRVLNYVVDKYAFGETVIDVPPGTQVPDCAEGK